MKCWNNQLSVLLLVVLLVGLTVPSFSLAQSFDAGLWKTKESVSVNKLPLPSSDAEECFSAAQAKDAKASIEKELKKHGCSLTKWNVKNQKLDASIDCNNQNFTASGKLQGSFTRKSYDLSGEASGTLKQVLPAIAEFKLSGQWIKNCTK